jgi:phosphatidylserine/phosphatidylglycerophosphate/cardiolipin synthase-like enzyme
MTEAQPQEQRDLSKLTREELLALDPSKLTDAEALEWEWCEYMTKCKSTEKRYEQPWYNDNYGQSYNNLKQISWIEDLNKLLPYTCNTYRYGPIIDPCLDTYTDAQVRPVFRDIEAALLEEIAKHDVVVGCVAWFTSQPILNALQGKQVQFIVQQEDWLRTDSGGSSMRNQRDLYHHLTGVSNCIAGADADHYYEISPIRLSGKAKNGAGNNARMHHKFMLFGSFTGEYAEGDNWGRDMDFTFDLAWTGSYNLTSNATRSLENGLFIKSSEVVKAYYHEWRQVLASSFRVPDIWRDSQYRWSHSYDEDLLVHFSDSDLPGRFNPTNCPWGEDYEDLRDGT